MKLLIWSNDSNIRGIHIFGKKLFSLPTYLIFANFRESILLLKLSRENGRFKLNWSVFYSKNQLNRFPYKSIRESANLNWFWTAAINGAVTANGEGGDLVTGGIWRDGRGGGRSGQRGGQGNEGCRCGREHVKEIKK